MPCKPRAPAHQPARPRYRNGNRGGISASLADSTHADDEQNRSMPSVAITAASKSSAAAANSVMVSACISLPRSP